MKRTCCSTIPSRRCWAETAATVLRVGQLPADWRPAAWKNQTVLINDYYTRIILGLSDHHWDYDIADDEYLAGADVEGNELVIGPQRFRAIILPPITTLSRNTLKKLLEFHRAGGILLGIRLLPTASPEAGADDAVIKSGIASIFGTGVAVLECRRRRAECNKSRRIVLRSRLCRCLNRSSRCACT